MSPLAVFFIELAYKMLAEIIALASSDDLAKQERIILLKAQRIISDELARRDLAP